MVGWSCALTGALLIRRIGNKAATSSSADLSTTHRLRERGAACLIVVECVVLFVALVVVLIDAQEIGCKFPGAERRSIHGVLYCFEEVIVILLIGELQQCPLCLRAANLAQRPDRDFFDFAIRSMSELNQACNCRSQPQLPSRTSGLITHFCLGVIKCLDDLGRPAIVCTPPHRKDCRGPHTWIVVASRLINQIRDLCASGVCKALQGASPHVKRLVCR